MYVRTGRSRKRRDFSIELGLVGSLLMLRPSLDFDRRRRLDRSCRDSTVLEPILFSTARAGSPASHTP